MRKEDDTISPRSLQEIIERSTRERLVNPITTSLFDEYLNSGIMIESTRLLSLVEGRDISPVIHTLTTHVTKEKPVFIQSIGNANLIDSKKTTFIAASTDILWALSLIIDDISDKDVQRAGRDTAWVKFGKNFAYQAADEVRKVIMKEVQTRISPFARELLEKYIDQGLLSLNAESPRGLSSNPKEVFDNIREKALFHCNFPAFALFPHDFKKRDKIVHALHASNLGGQILNDIKDLVPSLYHRRELYSDIREQNATIPILMLYNRLPKIEKLILTNVFKSSELTNKDKEQLGLLVRNYLPRSEILKLITGQYKLFDNYMHELCGDSNHEVYSQWVDYKTHQAINLLGEIQ